MPITPRRVAAHRADLVFGEHDRLPLARHQDELVVAVTGVDRDDLVAVTEAARR